MNITPTDLESRGYTKLDILEHNELVPFVRTYMRKRTLFSLLYIIANILCFGLAGYLFTIGLEKGIGVGDRMSYFSYGLAISLALVPLHEYVHVLAYRSQGAKNTSYGANLKKFYFMAMADKFVANRKEFRVVALAPFVTISTIFLMLLLVVNGAWMLTIAGTLLAHTAMCSGDFALLSYFSFHGDKDVVTYDDIENKVSYFYARSGTDAGNA